MSGKEKLNIAVQNAITSLRRGEKGKQRIESTNNFSFLMCNCTTSGFSQQLKLFPIIKNKIM